MLKVRLQRVGRRNDPSFRVVVTDSTRGPKSGKYIEMLGSYNPRQKSVVLNGDRIKYWMSVGAKVTGTMHNLLIKEKITSGKKVNVLPKKSPIVQVASKESDKETAVSEDNETLKHGSPKGQPEATPIESDREDTGTSSENSEEKISSESGESGGDQDKEDGSRAKSDSGNGQKDFRKTAQ
ncbi:30S ribosomal protein S16 [Patescibacteria group bacterium]|nr:30S ribosomal protein S16 [Patescibacteria group bacterium]